jgi:hypothetical protein
MNVYIYIYKYLKSKYICFINTIYIYTYIDGGKGKGRNTVTREEDLAEVNNGKKSGSAIKRMYLNFFSTKTI